MASTIAARQVAEPGRHIFIYNNIRTNQTVYSLQRSMNNHAALAQLAYAGKKTIPAKLRKDVWRPLATVTFHFPLHGLVTYRKLREFRKLHELHWDNNKQYPMLPPETQRKMQSGKAPTKKERAKIIMDQKANTVADLAHLLRSAYARAKQVKQDAKEKAEAMAKEANEAMAKMALKEAKEDSEISEMEAEAYSKNDDLAKERVARKKEDLMNRRITEEEKREKMIKNQKRKEMEQKRKERDLEDPVFDLVDLNDMVGSRMIPYEKKQKLMADIEQLEAEHKVRQVEAEGEVKQGVRRRARNIEAKLARKIEEKMQWDLAEKAWGGRLATVLKELEDQKVLEESKEREHRMDQLNAERDELVAATEFVKEELGKDDDDKEQTTQPGERSSSQRALEALQLPKQARRAYGVTIRWADILDASYANNWPRGVHHGRLGLTRHHAPNPNEPPMAFPKARQRYNKKAADVAEEGEKGEEVEEVEEVEEAKVEKAKVAA